MPQSFSVTEGQSFQGTITFDDLGYWRSVVFDWDVTNYQISGSATENVDYTWRYTVTDGGLTVFIDTILDDEPEQIEQVQVDVSGFVQWIAPGGDNAYTNIDGGILHGTLQTDQFNESAILNILPQNTPPIAANDFGSGFGTDNLTPVTLGSVLTNDTDPDGDALSVVDVSGATGIVQLSASGSFSYDPNGRFDDLAEGEIAFDTFQYTVSDGVAEDTATVTVTIVGAAEPCEELYAELATYQSDLEKDQFQQQGLEEQRDLYQDGMIEAGIAAEFAVLPALAGLAVAELGAAAQATYFALGIAASLAMARNWDDVLDGVARPSLEEISRTMADDLARGSPAEQVLGRGLQGVLSFYEAAIDIVPLADLALEYQGRIDNIDQQLRSIERSIEQTEAAISEIQSEIDQCELEGATQATSVQLEGPAPAALQSHEVGATLPVAALLSLFDQFEQKARSIDTEVLDYILTNAELFSALPTDVAELLQQWSEGNFASVEQLNADVQQFYSELPFNTNLVLGTDHDDVEETALIGTSNNDQIIAFAGNDELEGGDGDDTLSGGSGNDTLEGGAGTDRFDINSGDEQITIQDFEMGLDIIDLLGFDRADALSAFYNAQAGSAILTFGDGTVVIVEGNGVSPDTLSLNDVEFAAGNLSPEGAVFIEGTAVQGETLTANTDAVEDPDGIDASSEARQWLRDSTPIPGAIGESYLLTQEDVGSQVSVVYSYTDNFGTDESVTSAATVSISQDFDVTVSASRGFDFLFASFFEVRQNAQSSLVQNDVSISLGDTSYSDYASVIWRNPDGNAEDVFDSGFFGDGFVSSGDDLVSGTVNALIQYAAKDLDPSDFLLLDEYTEIWRLEGADFPVAEFNAASLTAAVADDLTLQERIFSGNDMFLLSSEVDVAFGHGGNDRFVGDAGDDHLNGGAGQDTAVYSGNQTSYTLTLSPTGTMVTDRRADGNGSDTLVDMEFLDFGTDILGGPFNLGIFGGPASLSDVQLESFIELYIAYFNRAPDAIGLNFWGTAFANGLTLEEMAAQFGPQDETQAAYPPGTSNEVFATTVYNNVLGRTPDQAGIDFWVGQLDMGNVSRDQFILNVLQGAKSDLKPELGQDFVDQQMADQAYLENKIDIGAYFAVHKGMSDVDNASTAMAQFDGTEGSITDAVNTIDGFFTDALDPTDGEFLMPLVGVLDDPFMI